MFRGKALNNFNLHRLRETLVLLLFVLNIIVSLFMKLLMKKHDKIGRKTVRGSKSLFTRLIEIFFRGKVVEESKSINYILNSVEEAATGVIKSDFYRDLFLAANSNERISYDEDIIMTFHMFFCFSLSLVEKRQGN